MNGEPIAWNVSIFDEGGSFRWGYLGEDLVAEWSGVLRIQASRSGELKSVQAVPGVSEALVEKTRLGVATAFLRAQRDQHSLHASAVALHGTSVVCVGQSGEGKSTLAEHLCSACGAELLADDMAAVELLPSGELLVLPTERTLWLSPDASVAKRATPPARVARQPIRLSWIVVLAFEETASTPRIRALRGGEAISAVLPSLIRFEANASQWERELGFLERLTRQGRIVHAARSRRVKPELVAAALEHVVVGRNP